VKVVQHLLQTPFSRRYGLVRQLVRFMGNKIGLRFCACYCSLAF
jgi:hypothetical protein